MDLERIAVYYVAKDGGDWASYLQSKLNAKDYDIETVLNDLNCDPKYHTSSAKLNLFIVTPEFLEKFNIGTFFEGFQKRTSLLILTGTEHADIERIAEANNCVHLLEWLIHELSANDDSVRELLLTIIGVYEGHVDKYLKHSSSESENVYDTLPKARQVNKVYDIVQKGDNVYVMLERLPEGQITIQFPLDEIKPEFLSKVAVFTFNCSDIEESEFKVVQEGDKIGMGSLVNSNNRVYQTIPKSFSSVLSQTDEDSIGEADENANTDNTYDNEYLKPPRPYPVSTARNSEAPEVPPKGCSKKSSQSKLELIRSLLEEETDPERMLCECFGIEKDTRRLDRKLASMVESAETMKHLSLLVKETREEPAEVTWPSLLHFGAEFNLVNFCETLLSNPLLYHCCSIPNKDGLMPHQLAQLRGHTELAEMLKQFLKFVKAAAKEGKYDSGFSTDTPRLSTISQHVDPHGTIMPPPVPHMTTYVGRYLNETNDDDEEDDDEDDYINQADVEKVREMKLAENKQSIHSDKGYSESIQEETDEDDTSMDELFPLPSPHDSVFSTGSDVFEPPQEMRRRALTAPFDGMLDISKLEAYDPHQVTKSLTDPVMQHACQVSEPQHRRKDIISLLGIQTSPGSVELSSSPGGHKKGLGIMKLFHKKPKSRSKSEPNFPKNDFDHHLMRKQETHYKKQNAEFRSSGTSSGSTNSTISGDDDDNLSVELRSSAKSKKNLKQILMSKRRKSIRLKNVLKDSNLSGPKLPSRKNATADATADATAEFF